MSIQAELFASLIKDKKRFIETLLVIENKSCNRVPFTLNPIQADVIANQTGRDIYVKPAQVGLSSLILAERMVDTITTPGTNTVLIAFEEFITQRLLDKAQFFYNTVHALQIPGFPQMSHRSSYEKTFPSIHSSMYISSARSFVAGRAETIHHLICDELAFWEPGAIERIFLPALERVPPDGTVDVLSTPNGEDNDFCGMYRLAKDHMSVFMAHFYRWFDHPEYSISIDQLHLYKPQIVSRLGLDKELKFNLEEKMLVKNFDLTQDQIRWRRYKIFEMESLRRTGELRRLFPQEYPENDVDCFLATGDMYYDTDMLNDKAKNCYPAEIHKLHADIWYPPEPDRWYIISIDPGQAKVTQTAITVLTFDEEDGIEIPKYCARAAGLWTPEVTKEIAWELGHYYNWGVIVWEANSHGMALAPLMKEYPNLYYRRDIINGRESNELGWYTSPKTKDYMLATQSRMLSDMTVHDIEFISQCRNIRLSGDQAMSVGIDDIHDACCIGLVCRDTRPVMRGYVGSSGYKW